MSRPHVFLREATGLVREFSATDAAILGIGAIIGPTWVVVFASEWFLFPGVSVPASFALAGILSLLIGFYYALIAAVMPRSGSGGYVPLSRVIHPIVGMAMSFVIVIANILNLGFIANIVLTVGVSGPLLSYGLLTSNPGLQSIATLLSTPTWGFLLGSVVIVLVALVMLSGTRTVRLVNKIAIILGTVGFLVIIGILATTSQPQFETAFNSIAGAGAYQNTIKSAHNLGWSIPADWVTPTLLSVPLSWFAMLGGFYNVYWSGEVKRVQRSMLVSVAVAILYSAFFFSFIAFMMERSFGIDFLTSAGYLFSAQPAQYTFVAPPWVNTFVAVLNSNVVLNAIVIASFIAWGYFLILSYFLIASRHFFAWSFDRVFPSVMANVSERFHTPVFAITLTSVIAWVALIFYSFLPTILGPVSLTFLFVVGFMLDGLAGVALPWLKKSLFEAAPPTARRKIAGIPIISILGAYSIILMIFLFAACLYNPAIGGPFGSATEATAVIGLLLGAAIYLAMKSYGARRGVDISLAFKEIPPE